VHADRVIVAAGTIHTPGLLVASGIRNPNLGHHLAIHPCTAAWALMDEDVDMAHGVPQSYCVDEFADEGFVLEGIAGPPDYLAMAVPFTGDRHREVMLRYRSVAQFGLMLEDTSRGRIVFRRAKRPLIRYDVNARDRATLRTGVGRLVELFDAAGAREVFPPSARKLMAFHPLGTARAAADPARGVIDADGRVHGTENLYVADGSAVPTALGANPQMTIMAMARRLATNLIQ
jgi:choline dehydrogenase-like flavoprotein